MTSEGKALSVIQVPLHDEISTYEDFDSWDYKRGLGQDDGKVTKQKQCEC